MNIHLIIVCALSFCLAVMALSAAPEKHGAASDTSLSSHGPPP